MAFITENIDPCEVDFKVYLTPLARKIFLTNSPSTERKLRVGFFSAGDLDVNYNVLIPVNAVPDATGDSDDCLAKIAKCVVYGNSVPRNPFAVFPTGNIYCTDDFCELIYVSCSYVADGYVV